MFQLYCIYYTNTEGSFRGNHYILNGKKYGIDKNSLYKIRDYIVDKLVEEKKEFFTGKYKNNIDSEVNKQRVLDMKKDINVSNKIDNINNMIKKIESESELRGKQKQNQSKI